MGIIYPVFDEAVRGKKLVLFGAGMIGIKTLVLNLKGYRPEYFCDNDHNKWGKDILGIPIYSPNKLCEEDKDKLAVLITSGNITDIGIQLLSMGLSFLTTQMFNVGSFFQPPYNAKEYLLERYSVISRDMDKINMSYSVLADEHSKQVMEQIIEKYKTGTSYFGDICEGSRFFNDILAGGNQKEEVFVSGGTFNGDEILQIIKYTNNPKTKIYVFEPDPRNYWNICDMFANTSCDIRIYDYAISDENENLRFEINNVVGGGGSRLSNNGNHTVKAIKLDDFIDERVTFMKLNLQGSECKGLMGSKRIIREYKPKLAVCAYVNHDDIFRVPLLIHEILPEYKIYLRFSHPYKIHMGTIFYAKV